MATSQSDPTTLHTVLTELIPRRGRQVIYLVAAGGGLVLGVWQAAEGNWAMFAGGIFASLQGALAASNLNPPPTVTGRYMEEPLP